MLFGVNLWKQRLSSKEYQLILLKYQGYSDNKEGSSGSFFQDIGSYFWEKYKDDISFTTVKSSGVFNGYWSYSSLQCLSYMGWCQPKGKLCLSILTILFSGVLSPLSSSTSPSSQPHQGRARSVCSPLQVASYLKITTTSSRLVLCCVPHFF